MANLKNINLMSQDTFNNIEQVDDELYAVSASGIGFPSSRYEDLTLGASGTKYTAPANGWVMVQIKSNNAGQYLQLYIEGLGLGFETHSVKSGDTAKLSIPVSKGKLFVINHNFGGGVEAFRFVYAEGE